MCMEPYGAARAKFMRTKKVFHEYGISSGVVFGPDRSVGLQHKAPHGRILHTMSRHSGAAEPFYGSYIWADW